MTVPPTVARERLIARNGFSAEEADRRIASQITTEEREAHADVLISTDCTLEDVRRRVQDAWAALQARAGAR